MVRFHRSGSHADGLLQVTQDGFGVPPDRGFQAVEPDGVVQSDLNLFDIHKRNSPNQGVSGQRDIGHAGRLRRAMLRGLFALLALCGAAEVAAQTVPPAHRGIQFQDLPARPLEERILPAPAPVLDLVHRYNQLAGVDLRPGAASMDHPLVPLLRAMLRSLPEPVYRLASRHLAGVFLVERNFGSARSEGLWDAAGRLAGGFMVLNLTALSRPANAWATLRENSAFHTDGDTAIEVVLEPPATNTPEGALRFLFLHELGHVLGMGLGVHGHWAVPESFPLTLRSPFVRLSWRPDGSGGLHSPWKRSFPLLGQLRFYRFEAAPLPRSAAPLIYARLARTGFPSLYGTLDPYEDFAETFALYVHTRILGKPYTVVVRDGRRVIGTYRSCLQSGSCPAKAAFVGWLLGTRE